MRKTLRAPELNFPGFPPLVFLAAGRRRGKSR